MFLIASCIKAETATSVCLIEMSRLAISLNHLDAYIAAQQCPLDVEQDLHGHVDIFTH